MRPITVNGVEYEFKIGKRFTKVVPSNAKPFLFENKNYAILIDRVCDCCGVSISELYSKASDDRKYVSIVTKQSVRKAILDKTML